MATCYLAASFHWAFGGGAWARDAAVGGAAKAPLVNTPEIRQMMEAHWTVRAMNWQIANRGLSLIGILAVSLLSSLLITPPMYQKKFGWRRSER